MNPVYDATRQELTALLSTITALKQTDGPSNKGPLLLAELIAKPGLGKYFRWLIQAPAPDQGTLALAKEIPRLPPHLAHVAKGVCDRTLAYGATPRVVQLALERADAARAIVAVKVEQTIYREEKSIVFSHSK